MSLKSFETDEQVAEALIDWLKKNKGFLALLFLVVVGTIAGQHWYQDYKVAKKAGNIQVLDALALQKGEAGQLSKASLAEFLDQNKNKEHQALGIMTVAGELANQGDYKEAQGLLEELTTLDFNASLKQLSIFHLAKVLMELKEYDQALTTLQNIDSPAFNGLLEALLGDIYLAKGDKDQAREQYRAALSFENVPQNTLFKLRQLGDKEG